MNASFAETSSGGDLLAKLHAAEQRPSVDSTATPGWETVRQLGSGSHGRCYLMKRPDGTHIVHKRVPVSHMRAADQEVAEREVNILASFNHPYIVRYDRAFVRQGQLCIVMEHATKGDLGAHLRQLRAADARPEMADALDWFVQLLLALKYIHGHKVLHRDVALKNVFLCDDGVVKLGDFGVARVLECTGELAQTRVGTPCYISPERCEARPYSYASDVWAMGCLLYELLTARPAFCGETIPEVTSKILEGAFAPFQPADGVPPELAELVTRLLTVASDGRPSIDAILEDAVLQPSLLRHAAVRDSYKPSGKIATEEIPLIGYEGATKTKFSERPIFVDGGGRIVNEDAVSAHDAKMLGARQRRQRQLAERGSGDKGMGSNFEKVQNFGSSGVAGFLAAGGTGSGGGSGSARGGGASVDVS